jgi:nicotinate-nucleotide adenylyltransferase
MSVRPTVGLLGGTFDPIHVGHLAAARTAQDAFGLDQIRFIPSAKPPHRPDSPRASGYHRIEMVRLAVADAPGWDASDLELFREGLSYTYDTLATIGGEGLSPLQIFFITGADAFADITTWHRYPDVLDRAHFVVVARAGTTLDGLRTRLPDLVPRMIAADSFTLADTPRIILLNANTPDVSATEIRRRVAAGESVEGLVPDAVAAYIDRNSLYRRELGVPGEPGAPLPPGV